VTADIVERAEPRKRPRDRKQQILAAAAERFWAVGYHQISMAEIAAQVGIGASALYRHFRGKQELLLAILDGHLSSFEHLVAQPGPDLIRPFTALALQHREFGVLWEREAGHLPPDERRALRRRLGALAHAVQLQAATVNHQGVPGDDTADLRGWAVLSVLGSPSHHRTRIEPARHKHLLHAAASAVVAATVHPASPPVAPIRPQTPGIVPASRREALLAVAIRLFSERGYPSVGLDDVGAAAGIAGPSVYNHFDSKIDVLAAALNRGNEALWLGLHRALAAAQNPANALDRLTADYAAFAVAESDIVSILVSEIIHLPPERRDAFRRAERDYVTDWVTLLARARPDLTGTDARVLVHAALALINSLSRIHNLRSHTDAVSRTAALTGAIFTASPNE